MKTRALNSVVPGLVLALANIAHVDVIKPLATRDRRPRFRLNPLSQYAPSPGGFCGNIDASCDTTRQPGKLCRERSTETCRGNRLAPLALGVRPTCGSRYGTGVAIGIAVEGVL